MNFPDGITDILFFTAPALLVFFTSFFLIKKFLDSEQRMKYADLKHTMKMELLPMRFQAYERIVLFLERIGPNNLLVRVYEPGMNVEVFHKKLISTIRSEYEHNITQQVYVTNQAWTTVKTSRDELLKIINVAFGKSNPESPGVELSKNVFELMVQKNEFPIQNALEQIKNEAHQLFV